MSTPLLPHGGKIPKAEGSTKLKIMKAIWNGKVLTKSNKTVVIEGNHYFPPETVNWEFFKDSTTHTVCPWKGVASYRSLKVDGAKNKDAAWFYPEPKYAAEKLKNYIAFWKGVKIIE